MRVTMGSTEIATGACTGRDRLSQDGCSSLLPGPIDSTGSPSLPEKGQDDRDRDDRPYRDQIATEGAVAMTLENAAYRAVAFTGSAPGYAYLTEGVSESERIRSHGSGPESESECQTRNLRI
ncbi:hypothetical protein Taro_048290 [Colocasia esculenta]|uniref:Uncharacterized protein n=1 Tax=Colocasia esculenta TaxID=4460 RepID=A0A843X7C3_COLES|nr:hypothetical protein [Colocasia esculenta]